MTFYKTTAIAVALAMDAFAVSIAAGVSLKTVKFRQAFRLSWHFGFFQAMMPIIGWSAGISVRTYIEDFDHWIAFCLLSFVGGKMIKDAFGGADEKKERTDPTKGTSLVLLSVATSIDALAVGLSLAVINVSVYLPALVIGIVALLFTIAGLYMGSRVGSLVKISQFAELMGGLVLFAIGINILYEHGVF